MTLVPEIKSLIKALGFTLEDGANSVWSKSYSNHSNYKLKIDIENELIDFGTKIKVEDKGVTNFKQGENFVVLECVNRLLEKGYSPKNIVLEKTWSTGHGTSGSLDILVTRDNGTAYLMIECKTYGSEFDKAYKRLLKDGGQLFTYFQQDKNADILILYASQLNKKKLDYRNEIIKVEEDYRRTGNVKDFHDRWNKLTKNNGVFNSWVTAYDFQSKALTPKNLKEIEQEDSSFIFNQFLEILRHNVVSDKPNAFNKIFTLFLCKIYDERITKDNDELAFQWFYTPYSYEGINYPPDNNISFQKRLTDLYKKGMKTFLEKEVTDISDADFERKYGKLDENTKKQILDEFTEIRLKKNNEFAIKEVFDDDSFNENAKVVKEVVELLQGYKIRYSKKQQYLSDFFELLLTTGLKQESGQFFTPVPIAQFIIKSIPLDKIVLEKLSSAEKDNLLPRIIDYAAGSGHFLTESMHEVQRIIDQTNPQDFIRDTAKKIRNWKEDHFDWAFKYVYGIEKDYRLVKVGKVGCYLHGDGLAQVIHSDGLGNFTKTEDYKGLLKHSDKDFPKENKQFDIVISNPPYSVSAFKNNARKYYTEEDFDIYDRLTDQSSEIECLFVERTKQLLKDGGVAGVILPSSILSNTGVYTKAREMILEYFEVIAIAELGSNTFMATGTNTVTLFLRRRNNFDVNNVKHLAKKVILERKDITVNGIDKCLTQYVDFVWEGLSKSDYETLLKKEPNQNLQHHDIYKEYRKKIKCKNEEEFWDAVLKLESEKLNYFALTYLQKVVIVKSGEKNKEKVFLGYEFSNARGREGIHPIQRGKTIDECTKLFDPETFDNPKKASTYIYKAFLQHDIEIDSSLSDNVFQMNLVDMISFNRLAFDKKVSLAYKKKVSSKWPAEKLGVICHVKIGATPSRGNYQYYEGGVHPWVSVSEINGQVIYDSKEKISDSGISNSSVKLIKKGTTLLSFKLSIGKVAVAGIDLYTNEAIAGLEIKKEYSSKVLDKYLFILFALKYIDLEKGGYNAFGKSLNSGFLKENVKIPIPPKNIQEKLIAEYNSIEREEEKVKAQINNCREDIVKLISNEKFKRTPLIKLLETINPEKKEHIEKLEDNTEVSFLSMSDVSNYGVVTNLQKRKLKDVRVGFTFFQENDVLVAKITPCLENGKGALVPKLANNIGFGSTEFFVLRGNKDEIHPKILFYITRFNSFRVAAEKEMTGASGHKRVPKAFIENYQAPKIPYKEQLKVVEKIEKNEGRINALQSRLVVLSKKKEQIIKKYI